MGWEDTIGQEEYAPQTPSWEDTIGQEEYVPRFPNAASSIPSHLISSAVPFAASMGGAGKAVSDLMSGVISPTEFLDEYRTHRDIVQKELDQAAQEYPKTHLAASLPGVMMNPAFKGANTLRKMATGGGIQALGDSKADLTKGDFIPAANDMATGSIGGMMAHGMGTGASKLIEKARGAYSNSPVGKFIKEKYLKNAVIPVREAADKYAENATGATAKQTEKFPEKAGMQLRRRGLIKFGDTAQNIADKAEASLDQSGQEIMSALKQLDDKGVRVTRDGLINQLKAKVAKLRKREINNPLADQLEAFEADIKKMPEERFISEIEALKRDFQHAAGKNWMNDNVQKYNKALSGVYRREVEQTAKKADPDLSQMFEKGKRDYQIVAPLQEAAARRGAQQNQHPFGGFLDMTSAAAGAGAHAMGAHAVGNGILAGLSAVAARRFFAPRLSSSMTAALGQAETIMRAIPKYSNVILNAAEKSPEALAATIAILSKDPEVKKILGGK